ncbi:MAG: hypothetical protein WBP59_09570 [Ilumatobacteraceae bacterium]
MIVVLAIVVVLASAVALLVIFLNRTRRSTDDIASFRRQIDALSPEARRPTIDRMKPSGDPPLSDDGDDDT